ncbi:hypothetical protein SBY92_000341 [Candida maltosa Xu316]
MWPFTKSSQQPSDLSTELPADLQQVLQQESPSHPEKFEVEKRTRIVYEKLAKLPPLSQDEEKELERYKVQNSPRQVSQINCSELELYVMQCNNHPWYKFWAVPNFDAMKNLKRCENLNYDGLKLLHYNQCYNIKHCGFIRYHLDQLYIKNFGELGDNVNDATTANFYSDLNDLFYKAWK